MTCDGDLRWPLAFFLPFLGRSRAAEGLDWVDSTEVLMLGVNGRSVSLLGDELGLSDRGHRSVLRILRIQGFPTIAGITDVEKVV